MGKESISVNRRYLPKAVFFHFNTVRLIFPNLRQNLTVAAGFFDDGGPDMRIVI